ncbi:MAG: hypothetical protein SWK90_06450, partial [Chloroflexota bacterium]|nr:hypothetical protein [Chloroflexota bacterium]
GDQNHLLVEPVVMGIRGLAPDTLERHRYLLQCQRMCYNIKGYYSAIRCNALVSCHFGDFVQQIAP